SIDFKQRLCIINKKTVHEGDYITVDGNSGSVFEGKADVVVEAPTEMIDEIQRWKTILKN
ncbi:MAG TPA: hypothetical protein VH415_02375, partial [Nitrososphaeraceae archaeon]